MNRITAPELRVSEKEKKLKYLNFLRSKIDRKEIVIQTIKVRKENTAGIRVKSDSRNPKEIL